MDVKQASKKWGCSSSTVRNYCSSGIIPPAEKIGRKWVIPDDCEKPPLTRHGLCFLMDTIDQIDEETDVKNIKWGYSEEKVREGCEYLKDYLFISSPQKYNFELLLKTARITNCGHALIERQAEKNKGKYKIKLGIGVGPLKFEGEPEV